jgi:hypothetical protein
VDELFSCTSTSQTLGTLLKSSPMVRCTGTGSHRPLADDGDVMRGSGWSGGSQVAKSGAKGPSALGDALGEWNQAMAGGIDG